MCPQTHPDGYACSQFCELYRRFRRGVDLVMRQEHKAGEELVVDNGGLGSDASASGGRGGSVRPLQSQKAGPGEVRTRTGTPRRGCSVRSALGQVPAPAVRHAESGTTTRTGLSSKHHVTVTASEARKNLCPLIEQVNENREPIEITSRRGDAVLVSRAEWDALNEAAMLLRVPANASWLLESLEQARTGERTPHDLDRGEVRPRSGLGPIPLS